MRSTTLRQIRRAIIDTWFRTDRERNENGQSLWTVLGGLLLASLIIAFFVVPNLLGARRSTFNDAAESNLQASAASFKTYYSQNTSYDAGMTPAVMKGYEPSLYFLVGTAGSTDGKSVSFTMASDGASVAAAAFVKQTLNCYYMVDVENSTTAAASWTSTGVITIGAGTFYASATGKTSATCMGSTAPTTGWNSNGFITTQ